MKLALALVAVLAFPGLARAGEVTLVTREVALGDRTLQSVSPPARFNLVGVHWQGAGSVELRTRRIGGGWGPWTEADDDAGPDPRSLEARRNGRWREGALVWTGASDRIQLRTRGVVGRVRAHYVWSPVDGEPARRLATAGQPELVSRFGWQANERIVRAKPQYAASVRYAVVHHTVNANAYSRAQAAAIVRGIQRYHVVGNGWNDIGYNVLIDRFGTVYEGRGGGLERNVVGAHTLGFNTGSFGVALIGTYGRAAPTAAQKAALARVLAWRLDVAHVDPLSIVSVRSAGNSRYRAGAPVRLRAVSGHRDAYFTECPGDALYAQLPAIARAAARIGLPKIYSPATAVVEPGIVRFTARLSSPAAWTVTVRDAKGAVVATGKGRGAGVDWAWDRSSLPKGAYAWSIEAPNARPATGSLGGKAAPQPLLADVAAAPRVVAPAADGSGSTSHVSFALGRPARVAIRLLDAAGTVLLDLLDERLDAGVQGFDWVGSSFPDGRYRLALSAAADDGAKASAALDVVVDRTLTRLAAVAPAISPNGDGILDTQTFSFTLAARVPVRVEIWREGAPAATVFSGELGPGPQVLDWNGRDAAGVPLPDGSYQAVVTVTDALGEVASSLPLALDTTPPQLTLLDAARLRFSLSEPATLTLLVNGATVVKVEPAGVFTVPPPKAGVQTVSAQARDGAGNVSATVSSP